MIKEAKNEELALATETENIGIDKAQGNLLQ